MNSVARQQGERVILIQINSFFREPVEALAEFKSLASSDQLQILEVITGRLDEPTPKYFIGEGKAQEIKNAVMLHKAEAVIFNHELTPAQNRNLEQLLNCRVIDRTELILDIFAKRAQTFEGKLQVELAQLQHLRSRLVRGWTHLERQKGGIGLRGPGETQLETDRRLVQNRIKTIKKRLEKVVSQREQQRKSRQRAALPTIAIVGYTNAGKSTLFNVLTDSRVYVANQLFATLDPTTRRIIFPKLGAVMFTDTVGFIRDLPHDLVAAFRATLEETRQADLLIHVVDLTQHDPDALIDAVNIVLKEIDARHVPQLIVYNKIDQRAQSTPRLERDSYGKPERVWVSAVKNSGIDLLQLAITELMRDQIVTCEIKLFHHEGALRSELYALGVVKQEQVDEEGHYHLSLEIQRGDYERLIVSRKKFLDKTHELH